MTSTNPADCLATAPTTGAFPRIGIVIPVYGHSRLMAEAISSALTQNYRGRVHIAIVIDGDPSTETADAARSFMSDDLRQVSVLYRPNGRLPAARNTGIKYLISRFDDLFGIYFLDADNRLTEDALRSFVQVLIDNPKAAWAYPDVTFFGLSWGYSGYDIRETAPVYSRFRHLMGNICEAGSLVRASVFREGILFDESFTSGYEDWEFWLQCMGKGYFGKRVENAGFLYRRRADSMLSDANRVSDRIRRSLIQKHDTLFADESRWSAYISEFPIAYYVSNSTQMILGGLEPFKNVSHQEIFNDIIFSICNFHYRRLPNVVIVSENIDVDPPTLDDKAIKSILENKDDGIRFMDAYGNASETRSDDSLFTVVPLAPLLQEQGGEPNHVDQTLPIFSTIREAVALARETPLTRHASRRYAGPANYRIVPFLTGADEATNERPIANEPTAKLRGLLIHRATAERPSLLDRLAPKYEIHAIDFEDINTDEWHGLKSGFAQTVKIGVYTGTQEPVLHHAVYNGSRIGYREDNIVYRSIPDIVLGFDIIFIMDDIASLFNAGHWKVAGKPIVYLATSHMGLEEMFALQGMEHSVTAVICSSNDKIHLSAYGLPSSKLQTLDEFLATSTSTSTSTSSRSPH